ncbi:MAG: hypothetical protein CMP20_04055 [Rickettsiales bacterium]|nr:hypothetical protein [Rickettsiales bacterium]
MNIQRVTIAHPDDPERTLAFHTTLLSTHRAIKKAMEKKGYIVIDTNDEIADISSAKEALDIAATILPL